MPLGRAETPPHEMANPYCDPAGKRYVRKPVTRAHTALPPCGERHEASRVGIETAVNSYFGMMRYL